MSPQVRWVLHGASSTYSYVVWDPETLRGAVVDPALDFDPKSGATSTATARKLLDIVADEGLTIDWVLETHAHADHISAAPFVRDRLGAPPVAIGEGIRIVQKRFKRLLNLEGEFSPDGSQFDHLFADGERFSVGKLPARAVATPGHTSDHLSYVVGDAVFVGDTLFMPDAGTARCDFPGGDARTLLCSTRRLFAELDDATRMFVLHDYGTDRRERANETTVGQQRRENIHVREGVSEDEYVRMREGRDATLPLPTLIILAVQVNIRAGHFPPPEANGVSYLKMPVDVFRQTQLD